jgi:hypothetical protein
MAVFCKFINLSNHVDIIAALAERNMLISVDIVVTKISYVILCFSFGGNCAELTSFIYLFPGVSF